MLYVLFFSDVKCNNDHYIHFVLYCCIEKLIKQLRLGCLGIYWSPQTPRLITIPDAKTLISPANTPWIPVAEGTPQLPSRLIAISDISADPGGSIQFMNECTSIDEPFCL